MAGYLLFMPYQKYINLIFLLDQLLVFARLHCAFNLSKFMKTILAPLLGRTDNYIKNSTSFSTEIIEMNIEDDESMISFDVQSLFTSITLNLAQDTIKLALENDQSLRRRTSLSIH